MKTISALVMGLFVYGGLLSARPLDQLNTIPFKQWRLSDSIFIEAAFGIEKSGHLDGPLDGIMIHGVSGVGRDTAGNIYVYDYTSSSIRYIDKKDGRMYTLTGDCGYNDGLPLAEGPAHALHLGNVAVTTNYMVYLLCQGDPLSGNGCIIYSNPESGPIIRIYRNMEKDGIWWYKTLNRGTKTAGEGVLFSEVKTLYLPKLWFTQDGKLQVTASNMIYNIDGYDGVMTRAIRKTLFDSISAINTQFYPKARMLSGKYLYQTKLPLTPGGAVEGCFVFINSDGQTLDTIISYPVDTFHVTADSIVVGKRNSDWDQWADYKRDQFYWRSMDTWVLNRMKRSGEWGTLCKDGQFKTGLMGFGGFYSPTSAIMGTPGSLQDGTNTFCSTDYTSSLFLIHYLDSIGQNNLVKNPPNSAVAGGKDDAINETQSGLSTCPNPFNPTVTIAVKGRLTNADIKVFNVSGKMVADLEILARKNGKNTTITWDASNHPSGMFVVKAVVDGKVFSRKIMLLK